jgi:hypothetical protein
MLLEDMTVAELWELERSLYGRKEIVTTKRPTGWRTDLQPVGTTVSREAPALWRAWQLITSAWFVVLSAALVVLLLKSWLLMRAVTLRARLHQAGYTFTLWQCERLYTALGRRAWQIPPRDELGALPAVDPDQAADLVKVMRNRSG